MSKMEKIGTSSMWEYKYRPTTIDDMIIPDSLKKYFSDMAKSGNVDNLMLYGSAGRGKTSVAIALCNDAGVDYLYINASNNNSVNMVRNDIEQFATTFSLDGNKKAVILDEAECLTDDVGNGAGAQNALKAMMEVVEKNCRFILTTNNLSGINSALLSRCGRTIDFNFSKEESEKLKIAYFKRLKWILDNENISYDPKVLANFVIKNYPDFRMTLNRLQFFTKLYGKVDENILFVGDTSNFESLISEMKAKKWNNCRKIISEIDTRTFFSRLYDLLSPYVEDNYKPELVLTISEWDAKAGVMINKENAMVSCITSIIKEVKWS